MLVVARLIGGIGIGMLSMVAPLYISEIAPAEIRGALLVLEEFSIVSGIVIAFWITYGTQYMAGEWAWRLPFLLQMVPGIVLGAGILFLPFSPRWLVSKGRDREAGRSLSKLRQLDLNDSRVQQEWIDIRAEVAFHREVSTLRHPKLQDGSTSSRIKLEIASWIDCFKRGCWRRTHVGVLLMFFQVSSQPVSIFSLVQRRQVSRPCDILYQNIHIRIRVLPVRYSVELDARLQVIESSCLPRGFCPRYRNITLRMFPGLILLLRILPSSVANRCDVAICRHQRASKHSQ